MNLTGLTQRRRGQAACHTREGGYPAVMHGTGRILNRMPSSALLRTRSHDEVDAGRSQDVTNRPAFSRAELMKIIIH